MPLHSRVPCFPFLLLSCAVIHGAHYAPTAYGLAEIRSVDWCGYRGMLPFQRYHGPMVTPATPQLEHRSSKNHYPEMKTEVRIHLQFIYVDSHLVAVAKASGALSVPGPRRNPSVANLVHAYLGNESDDVSKMSVHRLDMDTSGVIVYARSDLALGKLNEAFRDRTIKKKYQALVCGHISVQEGEINLPLERDKRSPPFMCVAIDNAEANGDFDHADGNINKHDGWHKMMRKAPKQSLTLFEVVSYEFMDGLPVTRLALTPVTGRRHQLRVHCSAIGHPIVGDDIYGIRGEGTANGGISKAVMDANFPDRASLELQSEINQVVQSRRQAAREKGMLEQDACCTGGPGNLCLHAQFLSLHHPLTNAPIVFTVDPEF